MGKAEEKNVDMSFDFTFFFLKKILYLRNGDRLEKLLLLNSAFSLSWRSRFSNGKGAKN